MALIVALGTFITVTLTVYGLFYRGRGNDLMDARLGGLRYEKPNREELPDPEAAFSVRVLRPLMRAVSRRANGILPSTITQRLEGAITRAGLRIPAGQLIIVVAVLAGVLPLLLLFLMANNGASAKSLLMIWGAATAFGVYGPRIWLLGRIKARQKEIQKSLPDAFDLITASVEAGLGIDAAFQRVIEKVKGPFAAELSRTMREISMGRARREALLDLVERTGVEDLRSLVNSIVQAEAMGISIGGVIRVQTGVMRTKRRQRAEEQAFKAPIKMVFPLVFFIFPSIGLVIGGPAMLALKDGF